MVEIRKTLQLKSESILDECIHWVMLFVLMIMYEVKDNGGLHGWFTAAHANEKWARLEHEDEECFPAAMFDF